MSTIEDLEGRLAAAMDRIAAGVAHLDAGAGGAPDLTQDLEDERLANAQLQERVRKLSERAEAAETSASQMQDRVAELDVELQRMRRVCDALRAANAGLREANAEGVGDPHLINKAMLAELEALRATRAADAAEADTIITALEGLLNKEAAHA